MNNMNIIDKKVEIHKDQTKRLIKIESELITLISNTNDYGLMNKFLDWQNQRTRCNETYNAILNVIEK